MKVLILVLASLAIAMAAINATSERDLSDDMRNKPNQPGDTIQTIFACGETWVGTDFGGSNSCGSVEMDSNANCVDYFYYDSAEGESDFEECYKVACWEHTDSQGRVHCKGRNPAFKFDSGKGKCDESNGYAGTDSACDGEKLWCEGVQDDIDCCNAGVSSLCIADEEEFEALEVLE